MFQSTWYHSIFNKIWSQKAHEDEDEDVADDVIENVERTEEFADTWLSEIDSDRNRLNDGNDIVVDRPVAARPQKSALMTGKITSLSGNNGMIDGKHFFNRGDAPVEGLEVGKSVNFHLYRSTEQQEWRVQKILSVIEEMWNNEDDGIGNVPSEEPPTFEEEIVPVEDCSMNRRTIVGEVKQRQNRKVVVRDILQMTNGVTKTRDTEIDLDKLDAGFNPLEGDMVTIDAIVEVSEDVIDGNGIVLEVKSMKPTRSRTDEGIVTRWERQHHNPRYRGKGDFGVINDDIYFEKVVCDPGYIPKKGDEVRVDMIQCQRDKFKWRAILVAPIAYSQYTEERRKAPERLYKIDPDLLPNKGDLVVQDMTDYGKLKVDGNFKIELTVTNVGHTMKKIKYYLDSQYSNLKIASPKTKSVAIDSKDHVTFCFDYNKDFLGHFSEVFVIECDGFEIGREIKWEVIDSEIPCNEERDAAANFDKTVYENQRGEMAEKYMDIQNSRGKWVPGVKPIKGPSFVKVRFPNYDIDDQIKSIMTTGSKGQLAARKDSARSLKECCPELAQPLSASNHNRRFHHLLHIAEVDAQIQMSRHTKERVCFVRRGQASEFLALEIPGLAEGRPSLLYMDSVVAIQSFNRKAAPLMGYVCKVLKNEVWLQFDPYIHHTYNGEDFDVYFNVSRSCYKKSHAALDICQRNQANLWLFPKGVRTKPPQIALELPEDAEFTLSDVNRLGAIVNEPTDLKLDTNECSSSVQSLFESFKLSSNQSQPSLSGSVVPLEEIERSLHSTVPNERRSKTALLNLVKSKSPQATSPPVKNESHGIHTSQKVKLQWINSRLNQRQKEAVQNILLGEGRPLPYIIFGPPGTGKTVTLVETILQIYTLISSSRILIATPSNSSANLIAERLLDSKLLQPGDMVRLVAYHLVSEGKISPKLVPYSATVNISNNPKDDTEDLDGIRKLSCTLIMSRRIIVGTCMALGQMQLLDLPKGHFSHIVIDEAGQATEPEILIPLGFMAHESGQAILAGDPHQLGPVVPSDIASSYGLAQSLLSRLLPKFPYQRDAVGFPESGGYDPRLVTRLSVNYRSLPDILELPSSLFYDSDLEPSLSDTTSFEAKLLAQVTQQLQLPHSAVIFHGIVGDEVRTNDSPSLSNFQEAVMITRYVCQLLNAEVKSEDIGIITPYQKQVSVIRRLLEKIIPDKEDKVDAIKIGSVEEFQGQERMIIFLSTVRSSKTTEFQEIGRNTARQLLGFVNNKERLNVAISRARSLLLICANPNILSLDPYWRSVVKYCIDRKAYIGVDPLHQLIK